MTASTLQLRRSRAPGSRRQLATMAGSNRTLGWDHKAGLPASKAWELTEAQIAALFDAPTEQPELVRHYTLSAADPAAWAVIRRLLCNS